MLTKAQNYSISSAWLVCIPTDTIVIASRCKTRGDKVGKNASRKQTHFIVQALKLTRFRSWKTSTVLNLTTAVSRLSPLFYCYC